MRRVFIHLASVALLTVSMADVASLVADRLHPHDGDILAAWTVLVCVAEAALQFALVFGPRISKAPIPINGPIAVAIVVGIFQSKLGTPIGLNWGFELNGAWGLAAFLHHILVGVLAALVFGIPFQIIKILEQLPVERPPVDSPGLAA